MEKTYCVYIHTNKINGKKYVGQTCKKPESRWANGCGYKTQKYFYRAIEKYGWDGFEHEIIASNLTKAEADQLEKDLIKSFNTQNPDNGYNLTGGGDGMFGWTPSDEWIKKQRELNTGEHNPFFGKRHSEETKKKISEANSGNIPGNKGKPHTEKSKELMRENRKGKTAGENNPKARKVIRLSDKKIFSYLGLAAQEIGVSRQTLMYRCKVHKDWMYLDEYEQLQIAI
jgi:group I intron endonuclease